MFSRIHGWILFTADVSTAFLQGKRSDRGISVLLPAEACRMLGYTPGTRMKLLKSMYGLSDALRGSPAGPVLVPELPHGV